MHPWYAYALLAAAYLIAGLLMEWIGMALFDKRFSWRSFFTVYVIYTINRFLTLFVLGEGTAQDFICYISVFPILARFGFDQRGWRAFRGGALYFLAPTLMTALLYPVYHAITPERVDNAAVFSAVFNLDLALALGLTVPLSLLMLYISRVLRKNIMPRLSRQWVYVARPVAQTVITLAVSVWAVNYINSLGMTFRDSSLLMLAVIVCMAFQWTLSAVYVFQDYQLFTIARRNESLASQQRIYDALLAETRAFRHNIANMLCGFEGALMTGKLDEIEAYYAEMAAKCARINNENIVALERIPRPAVAAMLLQKLGAAADESLPVYMLASPSLAWKGLPDSDMLQVLGVLIDNAMEAARGARSPYVAIEFDNVGDAMEIAVRNTYDPEACDLSFLSGEARSNKPAHEGVGLEGARALMRKYPSAALNQIKRGRYIESLLLIESAGTTRIKGGAQHAAHSAV